MNIDGIEIPNKSLSNHDLDYFADQLNLRSFRGVYMRDELPTPINSTECVIVNLDDSDGPGTHWVCCWKTSKESMYSDSYGFEPPNEIYDYLKKPIHCSTNEIQ